MSNDPIELLDVVDEHDRVQLVVSREDFYARDMHYFRSVNGFIRNTEGKIWIPRRSADKKLFPLCLDSSVGGHVQSGESYFDAFVRELREETGLDPATLSMRECAYLTPFHGVSSFMKIYEIITDQTPILDQRDFVDASWMTPREVLATVNSGVPAKNDLIPMMRWVYFFKKQFGCCDTPCAVRAPVAQLDRATDS